MIARRTSVDRLLIQALLRTAIPLRSIAAGEVGR
jgi:hypothetical protein